VSPSLAALADLAEEQDRSTVELSSSQVRFRSVSLSDHDACLDWFAELIMTADLDDAGTDPNHAADSGQITALDRVIGRLAVHLRQDGPTLVESASWALGMSTAFELLAVVRSRLGAVPSTTVSLSLDQLRAATPPPDE
jgi:hypothetical protein